MKVVILCGGSGTRLREMSEFVPKPLIPIGGVPMVVHIMRWYAKFGFNEFVLALGYRQADFKLYFSNFDIINNDITVSIGRYQGDRYQKYRDQGWTVTLCDTGENTFKGGRLKRVEKYIDGDTFMLCYGDGLSNISIPELLSFHESHGKIVTITGVTPPSRFGEISHEEGRVISFSEKPQNGNCLVNGGFYVFNRKIFDYLQPNEWCDLEAGTLELLAAKDEMRVYNHRGWWGCMDNISEMAKLNELWKSGQAPWKI